MASLTLKDIPKQLHERLRERAARNRRSLSQEALACLEDAVAGQRVDAAAMLAKARRQRAGVKPVRQKDLEAWRAQGRA